MSNLTTTYDYSLHYNKWHQDTDAHFENQAKFYRRLLAPILADVAHDAALLDIGCGQGLLVNALQVFGYHNVTGIDISAEQIAVAARRGLNCRRVDPDEILFSVRV